MGTWGPDGLVGLTGGRVGFTGGRVAGPPARVVVLVGTTGG